MFGTAWDDLLDYIGRGNPGLQARNKFHAFFMLENQRHDFFADLSQHYRQAKNAM